MSFGSSMTPARFVVEEIDERAADLSTELPLLSVTISSGVVPREESGSSQAASEDVSHYKVCREGDIVINRLRAFQGAIGRSPVAGLVSPDYAVLRVGNLLDSRFAHYQMRSSWFVSEITKRLRGIGDPDSPQVRTPRINVGDLGRIGMYTPPLKDQRRVVDMLDEETARIDVMIGKNSDVLRALDSRLKAMIDYEFAPHVKTGGPLGYFAEVRTSGIDKHSVEGQRVVRLCNYTDVYNSREIEDSSGFMAATCSESEYSRLRLKPGDVVLTKDSETADDIGIPAIVRVDDPDLVLGYHNALLRVLDGQLLPDFLYWFLQTRQARDAFALKARGVTRVGLRVQDIAAIRVPAPAPSAQHDLAHVLWTAQGRMDHLSAQVQRQNDLLERRRRSLINAAVTGQLEGF